MDIEKKNKIYLNYFLYSTDSDVNENTPLICVDATDDCGTISMITEDELDLLNRVVEYLEGRGGSMIVTYNASLFKKILEVRCEALTGKPLRLDWKNFELFSVKDYELEQMYYAFGIEGEQKYRDLLQLCCDHNFSELHNEVKKKLVIMSQVYKNLEGQFIKKDNIIKMKIFGIRANFQKTNLFNESILKPEIVKPKVEERIDPVTGEKL